MVRIRRSELILSLTVAGLVLALIFNSRLLFFPCGGDERFLERLDHEPPHLRNSRSDDINTQRGSVMNPVIKSPRKKGRKEKVFGLGLSTAVTSPVSLADAMKLLGYKTIEQDRMLNTFMHHADPADPERDPNLAGFYDKVDSVWDIPTAAYYKQLHKAYPKAKYILTVQNPDAWYTALERHHNQYLYYVSGCAFPERISRRNEFVYGSPIPKRQEYIAAYNQHNADVQEYFSSHPDTEFLVVNLDHLDGDQNAWRQLCLLTGSKEGPCFQAKSWIFPPFPRSALFQAQVAPECPKSLLPTTGQRQPSKYAYVLILCDPMDDREGHFLRMVLVLAGNVREYDKENDIVVLVKGRIAQKQRDLLTRYYGIQVASIPPISHRKAIMKDPFDRVSEQANSCFLAKIHSLQLTQYEKILYVDSDIIFEQDPRFLFEKPGFIGWEGEPPIPGEPLNGGIYVMEPSHQAYVDLMDIVNTQAFNTKSGWLQYGPIPDWKNPGQMRDWNFWCAHSDQGIMYYYFDRIKQVATIGKPKEHNNLIMHFFGIWKPHMVDDDTEIKFHDETLFRKGLAHWNKVSDKLTKEGKLNPFDLRVDPDKDALWSTTT